MISLGMRNVVIDIAQVIRWCPRPPRVPRCSRVRAPCRALSPVPSSQFRAKQPDLEEREVKRRRRGTRNIGSLTQGLPDWAQDFALEANRCPVEEMRRRLKDVDRLGQTLRRLIQEKQKAKGELEVRDEPPPGKGEMERG